MQLSLDDPLWDHLPGAYGVEDVRGPLSSLLEQWDPELSNTLLWDRLYHQESLYPATWAALPWLWQIAGRHADAVAPLYDFSPIFSPWPNARLQATAPTKDCRSRGRIWVIGMSRHLPR